VRSIDVALGERSYQVHVGHGVLGELGARCGALGLGHQVAVIADETVAQHYMAPVVASLSDAGFAAHPVRFADGDASKTLATADDVLGQLMRAELDRTAWVLALGGGVVGDLAGFVAATFLRGISFVQVPTSVVAQVDASVGGKTAVNHRLGKNMVGAFHQPRMVLIDTDMLQTLPPREIIGGLGEIIKHAVIRDSELFTFLEEHLEPVVSLEASPDDLDWLIAANVRIKAAVVAEDERETGVRAILNYGHTVGHAIEAASDYTMYRHGECVILGMVAAGEIAAQRGLWSVSQRDRQDALLSRLAIPRGLDQLDTDLILARTRADKKRVGGQLRFVLPRHLGAVDLVDDVRDDEVLAAIRYVQQRY
jgi:3-dehydroquinate synthase